MSEQNTNIVLKMYNNALLFNTYSSQLPKLIRYSYGHKIENLLFDCLSSIHYALRLPKNNKELQIIKILSQLDTLIILTRLLHELSYLELKHYLKLCDGYNELLKMVGGWLAYVRNKN